jgi:hypothetical protein
MARILSHAPAEPVLEASPRRDVVREPIRRSPGFSKIGAHMQAAW